ncbi:class I SAM-dependent methyltransferase [Moraxella nasovis]|uniref:class I SAM-dependent methyltransferase n=1 Tax=Moraxella nasovis TaxID=2904121 RepID=UPI001F61A707|nr:class I SAM-dependent methyltransferase [Moraxella nasovis]UNU73472.1 class I SAM-dependent methyltransferase [Moraxella nasovis]
MNIAVIGTHHDKTIFDKLNLIKNSHDSSLDLSFVALSKLSDKFIMTTINDNPNTTIVAIVKNTPTLIKLDNGNLIKSHLNWQSLTKRIVTAGRKSELILQACKLTDGMNVIDGTAGFGHDSLILASTGAKVVLIEQNPLIALLLLFEKQMMNDNPNWQKLLSRITIHHANFLNQDFMIHLPKADVIYLDPMFPSDSYTAKVGKNMQVLHELANPPSLDDEMRFLHIAQNQLTDNGKVIVKRPILAPYLANQTPAQSISNDAIRFDKYQF